MTNKIYSKKGREMSKLMHLKEVLDNPPTRRSKPGSEQLSIRVPQDLVWVIDRISKHLGKTRTSVVVMLLDAVITEVGVETSEKLGKMIPAPGGSGRKVA